MGGDFSVSVTPSLVLWLSVLYYLSPEVTLPFLLAVSVHELGHWVSLKLLGCPATHVTLAFSGAYMDTPPLSYRQELLAAAGGPGMSLLGALFLPVFPGFSLYSLWLGLVNLLPLGGLDGGRILRCGLRLKLTEEWVEKIEKAAGLLAGGLVLYFGFLMSAKLNLGLWPMAVAAMLVIRGLL